MVRVAAKIISFAFHPLLLATYLILMLGIYFPALLMIPSQNLMLVTLIVFVFTFAFPVMNLLVYGWWSKAGSENLESSEAKGTNLGARFLKLFDSLILDSWKDRRMPFVFISIMYIIIAYLFYQRLPFSSSFNRLMIIIAALVVIATVITFFIKVSVHSLAMGGWIGILLPLIKFSPSLLWPAAAVIALSGVVISSRLVLNAHTLRETTIGSIAGLMVGYGGMILLF